MFCTKYKLHIRLFTRWPIGRLYSPGLSGSFPDVWSPRVYQREMCVRGRGLIYTSIHAVEIGKELLWMFALSLS